MTIQLAFLIALLNQETSYHFVLLLKEASFIKFLDISDEAEFPPLSVSLKRSSTPFTKAPSFNPSLDAEDNEDSLSINVDLVDSQSSLRDLISDCASDHPQENNELPPLDSDISSQEPKAHSTDID